MQKHLINILKILVPVAIIGWLLSSIDPGLWQDLRSRPKNWGLLSAAFTIEFVAVILTFVRWYFLVKSLEMKFSLADAFRLSFLGYLLNFVSAGSVGGDLFKAIFIAREQPGRRTEAVATVVVDRLFGLYALLLVSSFTLLLVNVDNATPAFQTVRRVTLICTGGGSIALLLLMITGFMNGRSTRWIASLPRIGAPCERLIISMRVYRDQRGLMAGILGMSMLIHVLLSASLYLLAQGLFNGGPTMFEHLVIVPLAMVAGALPLTPSGLGSFEFAMDELYRMVPAGTAENVSGVLIALGYRLVTIAIAAVGVVYYWTSRSKVDEVMEQAEMVAASE